MEQVFSRINVVKLELRSSMSAELANAIFNIRTRLKRDNIMKHFMIYDGDSRSSDNVKF